MQNGEGIRSSSSAAAPGGSITVTSGTTDSSVTVTVAGSDKSTSHKLDGNKSATITIPPVPPGTIIYISVGEGKRERIIIITVIAAPP